jgi:L-iditol 2-dehydrogenase
MKAAVLQAPHKLVLENLPDIKCPVKGLLIKVKACSICVTDVKMLNYGHKSLIYPRILGHEVVGVVEETDNNSFKVGDRVQIAPGLSCGECIFCQRDADNQCQHIKILGFSYNGGFAEYIAISPKGVKSVNRIPENISFEEASLAEPLACCINGQNRVDVKHGDAVLIFGAGPLGCLHAMLARLRGASCIIIAEQLMSRIKIARQTRADVFINTSKENVKKKIEKITEGRGVDVILLACLDVPVYQLFDILAPGGRICMFSGFSPDKEQVPLNLNDIHYHEFHIAGAYGCTIS